MAGKYLAEEPYERLANAIILQAASDYRRDLKKIKKESTKQRCHERGTSDREVFSFILVSGADNCGWRVSDTETSKRNMTIRVNPRELKLFQSEVR